MTPTEFKAAALAFANDIGPRAKIWASINYGDKHALEASVYTTWPTGDPEFKVYSDSFADLFSFIQSKWIEHQAAYRAKTIRKMALEIIRITAEQGQCTDAALRGIWQFSDEDVTTYGALACEDANKIANNGPFSIVVNGGANAPGLENVERGAATPLQ